MDFILLCLTLWPIGLASASVTLITPPNNHSTSTRPSSLNTVWSEGPGLDFYTGSYLIGNGYLGESILGDPANDVHYINIASLWLGGPFRNSTYSGGNGPISAIPYYHEVLTEARENIMKTGYGSVNGLMGNGNDPDYGSYSTAGYLNITSNIADSAITSYTRVLDMDQGLVNISWSAGNVEYNRITFCSFPAEVCVTHTMANASVLSLTYSISTPIITVPQAICSISNHTIIQRGRLNDTTDGIAKTMLYEIQAYVGSVGGHFSCASDGSLSLTGAKESWIIWTGDTEFDLTTCNKAFGYSCHGADPHASVVSHLASANQTSLLTLLSDHVADYSALAHAFTLDIGQKNNDSAIALPTDQLMNDYDFDTGSPLLEYLVYSYGRHLLISSTRLKSTFLPPNLQGIWAIEASNPWSGDFHYDVNLEMMQWSGEATDIAQGIENMGNWIWYALQDRGTDTARILYGVENGYVYHTASNLFGYTGMQGNYGDGDYEPDWSDFTAAPAWLLQHLYDHYIYNPSNTTWFKTVTYPLMKAHAKFQMAFLQEDTYFNDGTYVVAPCSSPEKDPVTLGCTWNQQQIFELFHNILKVYEIAGDQDTAFISNITSTLQYLYPGIRIGWWGQLQEFKLDIDNQTDPHRHLSHLLGVYPGWEISGYYGQSLGNQSILDAAAISLNARGNGTIDYNAGWEKIMRSVVASGLKNSSWAGFEYRYMIWNNLNGNLLSMYDGHENLFQMDANGGSPAAVVNMIFQSLDSTKEYRNVTQVNLLPALPFNWPSGSFTGGRLRDGLGIDLAWSNSSVAKFTLRSDRSVETRTVVFHSSSFSGKKATATSGSLSLSGTTLTVTLVSKGFYVVVPIFPDKCLRPAAVRAACLLVCKLEITWLNIHPTA